MIALIVLVVIILGVFLFKRFLDKHGKYVPSSLLMMFLKQVKDIEESDSGRVVVRRRGDYEVIVLIEDGKPIEAISVDMVSNKIYSGVVKDNNPGYGNLLVPIKIPFGSVDDELIELEDRLVDEVMEIIVKYKK
jgi:hypothetical protein